MSGAWRSAQRDRAPVCVAGAKNTLTDTSAVPASWRRNVAWVPESKLDDSGASAARGAEFSP